MSNTFKSELVPETHDTVALDDCRRMEPIDDDQLDAVRGGFLPLIPLALSLASTAAPLIAGAVSKGKQGAGGAPQEAMMARNAGPMGEAAAPGMQSMRGDDGGGIEVTVQVGGAPPTSMMV